MARRGQLPSFDDLRCQIFAFSKALHFATMLLDICQMVTNSGKLGAELMRLSRDGFSLQSILSGQREANKPTLQQMTAKSRRKVPGTEDPRKNTSFLLWVGGLGVS